MTEIACSRGEERQPAPAPAVDSAPTPPQSREPESDALSDASRADETTPLRPARREAPPLSSAALQLDDRTVCVPASWTHGSVRYGRQPPCRASIAAGARLGDGGAACDGCAYEPNEAITRRERRSHSDACCFTMHPAPTRR